MTGEQALGISAGHPPVCWVPLEPVGFGYVFGVGEGRSVAMVGDDRLELPTSSV
jgi:hypothetical protein